MRTLTAHPYLFALLSLLGCAIAAMVGYGWNIDGLQAITRYTGRMGLAWFSLLFVLSPWHALAPSSVSRLALRARRDLGLAFGLHHSVHLVLLLSYVHASGAALNASRAGGGAFAYLLLFLMMATSNNAAARKLGRANWRRLHRFGLWVLWIVFLLTYVGRIQRALGEGAQVRSEYVMFASLLVSLAFVRVLAFFSRHPSAN